MLGGARLWDTILTLGPMRSAWTAVQEIRRVGTMRTIGLCSGLAASALLVVACTTEGNKGNNLTNSDADDAGVVGRTDGGAGDAGPGDAGPGAPSTFSVGGTITGLLGSGLVLRNNAGDDISIASDGTFVFKKKLTARTRFDVTVATQPTDPVQTCSINGGKGEIVDGNITSITVDCATDRFTVGGTVTGLVGQGLLLSNNGGAALAVNDVGDFAFPDAVESGKDYAITVSAKPSTPSQTCTVTNGTGKVGASDVTDVEVHCVTDKFTVGGTVAGLAGNGLELQIGGGEKVAMSADGTFTFPTAIESGAEFTVAIVTQPTSPMQTCTVSGGAGVVGAGNVTGILVNCTTNTYSIGGTASGIAGSATLRLNGTIDVVVNAIGEFSFTSPVASGKTYDVVITQQPAVPSQTCTLTNASGTVVDAAVTNIALDCETNKFRVRGTVNGLAGSGLTLENNGGDEISITADGEFVFPTRVASGGTFLVTVSNQPTALTQTCTVSSGSGAVTNADIADVVITCATDDFAVGGTVTGMTGGTLKLKNGAGDEVDVTGNGPFVFPTKVLSGGTYDVTVAAQPAGQYCSVSSGSGTVTSANVGSVAVTCVPELTVTFPSTTSAVRVTPLSQSGVLGNPMSSRFYTSGDFVEQSFDRATPVSVLELDFAMKNETFTSSCGAGTILSWKVLVNDNEVGVYSWPQGGDSNVTIHQTYTFAPVAPINGKIEIRLEATSTVCFPGGAWDWLPGGTSKMR